jgi:hypothetical protein
LRVFAFTIAAAAGMLAISAVLAAPTTTVSSNSQSDLDRIVCKAGAAPTGSRLGASRTCRTQREWNDIEKSNQDALQQAQMKGNQMQRESGK